MRVAQGGPRSRRRLPFKDETEAYVVVMQASRVIHRITKVLPQRGIETGMVFIAPERA